MKFLTNIIICGLFIFFFVVGGIFFMWALVLATYHLPGETILEPAPTPTPVAAYTAEELWAVVEQWRVETGYKPYIFSQSLCEVAQERAGAIQSDWSHNGFHQHVKNGDYLYLNYRHLGENLARGFDDEQETLDAWLSSPSHRENLEQRAFTHSCIVVSSDWAESYAVQFFAGYI